MLRQREFDLFQRIINLNETPSEKGQNSALKWKVLIYDERGLCILSTLLKVSSLMDVGVTVYGFINSKRDPIPDVSAVYLIEPTQENLEYLANDIKNSLYESVYINFISPISQENLRQLAEKVALASDGRCVKAIYDQYIDFSSPDPGLFTLFENRSCLKDIYGYHATDESVMNAVSDIAMGLVSVFLTVGQIPRILYRKDTASERVCHKFSDFIKPLVDNFELWESRKGKTTKAPLLILLDRTTDLATGLHHSKIYQALVNDTFGIKRNSLKIDKKAYDLDSSLDKFWAEKRLLNTGNVMESVEREMKDFTEKYKSIKDNLDQAISTFPEYAHQQKSLSSHTEICHALLEIVQKNKVIEMSQIEETLLAQNAKDFKKLFELFPEIPRQEDKLRIATIAFLCGCSKEQLEEAVGQMPFLDGLQQFKSTSAGKSLIGKVVNALSKNFTVEEKCPLVQITRTLLDETIDGWDLMNPATGSTIPAEAVGDVYIFVCGPGNYIEYTGLMDYASKKISENIEITYGCTCMQRQEEYLSELMELGD